MLVAVTTSQTFLATGALGWLSVIPHYPWDFYPWRHCSGRMSQLFLSFISFLLSLSCLPHSSLYLILSVGREDALYLFHGLLGVILSHLYQ